ncbi:MAG: hypothetical protein K6G50_10705 [bacterium]|nr:hypothetical protein [bacterium]
MTKCPYCGGLATTEQYTKTKEGVKVLVKVRRCIKVRQGLSRATLKRNPNAASQVLCGRIDVLSEEVVSNES